MSINTTRRGLFALTVAGVGLLALPQAAEASPGPTFDKPPKILVRGNGCTPTWCVHYWLFVAQALSLEGLNPSLWTVEFEYDVIRLSDRAIVRSDAYREGVRTYSSVAIYDPAEGEQFGYPANAETAAMQAESLARTIREGSND